MFDAAITGDGGRPAAEVLAVGSARTAGLLRLVAGRLADQADELASTMIRAYEAEIPVYGTITDDALREDVHAVSSSLVRCWLTVMSSGESVVADSRLLEPLLQGARRRAAQGVDLQSMLRAYRVGMRVMWTEITGSHVWRGPALQAAMSQVGTWTLDFADRIETAVAAAYLDEAERIAREREHSRSALLNAILSGPVGEPIDGPAELEVRHSVAVARLPCDLDLLELERTGQLLEEEAGAVLWTVRHRSVVAALPWADGLERLQLVGRLRSLVERGPIAAIGIGGQAEGVAETRASYTEATAALRVGRHVGAACVHDYQDLAPLIALLEQPDRARRFATSMLAPLGGVGARVWLLPTLEAYLTKKGRLKEAAAALDVHLNTVKYRMKELRSHAGAGFADGDRATSLLLALRIMRVLEGEAASDAARSGHAAASEHADDHRRARAQ